MGSFILRQKAMDDLLSIGRYTRKEWGKAQQIRYLTQLDRAFHDLADSPVWAGLVMRSGKAISSMGLVNMSFFTVILEKTGLRLSVSCMAVWISNSICNAVFYCTALIPLPPKARGFRRRDFFPQNRKTKRCWFQPAAFCFGL